MSIEVDTTVILVNYNSSKFLHDCLNSLEHQDYQGFQIILIDNSCDEVEYQKIREIVNEFRSKIKIDVIKSKFNLGFAAGNNIALKRVNTPFLFMLNLDTVLDRDCIKSLRNFLLSDPNIGVACPKIVYYSHPNRIWYAGATLDPLSVYFSHHVGINELDNGKFDEITSTGYACGAALFTKLEVIKDCGYFNEHFFCYSEESELNSRIKQHNYKVMYYPHTRVLHKTKVEKGGLLGGARKNLFLSYLLTRNALMFGIIRYRLIYLPFFYTRALFELGLTFPLRNHRLFLNQLRAILMATLLGFRQRYNKSCRKYLKKEWNYYTHLNPISKSGRSLTQK